MTPIEGLAHREAEVLEPVDRYRPSPRPPSGWMSWSGPARPLA
jgi:hypothetical protein